MTFQLEQLGQLLSVTDELIALTTTLDQLLDQGLDQVISLSLAQNQISQLQLLMSQIMLGVGGISRLPLRPPDSSLPLLGNKEEKQALVDNQKSALLGLLERARLAAANT